MNGTHEIVAEILGQPVYGDRATGWGILSGGLDSWWDSVETRFETQELPGRHGAFDPVEVLASPRSFSLRGEVVSSSSDWSIHEVRSWLSRVALAKDLNFRVLSGGRWQRLRGAKVRGKIMVKPDLSGSRVEFEIPIWCADPLKYGELRTVEIDAQVAASGGLQFPLVDDFLSFGDPGDVTFPGVFRVENPGTADMQIESYTVRGPVDGFTITSETHTISFAGPVGAGQELVITPFLGGRAALDGVDVSHLLVEADWAPVPAGGSRGFLFTPVDAGAASRLIVSHSLGAWW